jgi:hypothetical protein
MDAAGKWRAGGLVLGIAVAGSTLQYQDMAAILGVPALAVLLGLGMLIGELALPRPERGPRAAAVLEVRDVRDYLPQPAARGVAALAAALAVLVLLVPIASPWIRFGGRYSSYYGDAEMALFPVLAVGLALGVAALLIVQVVRQPRSGVEGEALRRDEAWRRRTVATIIAGCGVLLSAVLAGGAFLAGPFVLGGIIGGAAAVAFALYTTMLLSPASTAASIEDTSATAAARVEA